MPIDTIVVSTVPHCNLQCGYCQNEAPFEHYRPLPMSLDLFRRIVVSYQDVACREQKHPVLRFCYAGGEPLLAGQAFFERAIAIQHEVLLNGLRVENTIQTNGTLLSDKWSQLFQRHGFSVSVSIDGPSEIHDLQRPLRQRNTSGLLKITAGLECLRQHSVPFGTLTVVTRNSLGQAEEILYFLASLRPNMMAFLPCVDRGPSLRTGEFGRFMIDLFDAWLQLDDPTLPVREFRHILNGMLGIRHTKGCQYAGQCPRHVNVAPDGKVSVCDQYIGKPEGYLGDLSTESLLDILSSERHAQFRSKSLAIPEKCTQCSYVALCNGGCPYRREPKNTLDYFCEDRKMLFKHIEDRLNERVTAIYDAAVRKGMIQESSCVNGCPEDASIEMP